ncbi:MAG: tRNA pseudouridine(13) synthase TruD [Gemmataceae bacterium]|nr:tRNA pseudouridine(13) synthase TruD [Gemmataceae bacterium]
MMDLLACINPSLLTADLPGVGGRIKSVPEDFEVEEIPAYEPSGNGDFLYLWLEKRDLGAEYFTRQIARRLNLSNGEVGTAGLKDRRAVTRQWVSVPASAEAVLGQLEGDGIRVLKTSRHSNKLRAGHLHGNRFRILIRDIDAAADAIPAIYVGRLRAQGLPNYYGPQRFGKDQETLQLGLSYFGAAPVKRVSPFLKKLALSAVQSALFNQYLGQRRRDCLLFTVLHGDVMAKIPFGGMFVAEDVAAEQRRFDAKEIVHAGPIFGRKTFPARYAAAEREQGSLASFGFSSQSFSGFGKLLQGTRRHNLVYVPDLEAEKTAHGLRLSFTLPAGSYATVLLREIMKVENVGDDEST